MKLDVAEINENATMDVRSYELDTIRNERIRGTTKVGEITKKVHEIRLKWYWHVMRREEHYVGRVVVEMKVQGEGREEDLGEDGWTK